MEGNKKLIDYVITYGPKSTRFSLQDTATLKDSPSSPNFRGIHNLCLYGMTLESKIG